MKFQTIKSTAFHYIIYRNSILLVVAIFLIASCKKDDKDKNNYLVSSQIQKTITVAQSQIIITTLSSEYPEVSPLLIDILYDVNVYKLIYKTHFKGIETNASGVICVPVNNGTFPVISFQNGTNTKYANAPSVNIFNELFIFLECLAGNGYIILIPDYIGFGESSGILHPYYHCSSNDAAIIDMIKAADEFLSHENTTASSNNDLFLLGYSQGGWATLSALDSIEQSGTLSKDIVAVSCGAGAYNVYDAASYIFGLETYPAPFYMPYFLESHIRNGFLNEPLTKYFNEPYASRIPGLFNGLLSGSEINKQLTKNVDSLLTENLRVNFNTDADFASLRDELNKNSVSAWASNSKLLFVHGTADDNVPPFETDDIYNDFIQMGVPVEQITKTMLDGKNHDSALLPWGIQTFLWFNELKN